MNAKDAWLATLGQLQVQLNRSTYDTWLRHVELLAYEDGRFVVSVPHAYAKDWIDRHLLASMTETLTGIFQRGCEIQVIVWDPVEDEEPAGPLLDVHVAEELADPRKADACEQLNPGYIFDTFVTGEANRYAALLARAIVDGPPGKYSPVLFHGDMGMGKTHLLQAIAHGLMDRGLETVYQSAEDFTTELVAAIRHQDTAAFRDKYRRADAVIIDDLQFVEGKDSTQSELVAIWDALRNRRKTMIFASDRLPHDMSRVTKDARSRFQAGPIASLEAPDRELRKSILAAKSVQRRMALPADVRDMIADGMPSSPRDLEAAIDQLDAYTQLVGGPVTREIALSVLKTLGAAASSARPVELTDVVQATAAFYGLTPEDLGGRKRTKVVVHARQIAMFLARQETDSSFPQIGAALGGRDHTTVLHGCTRIADLVKTSPAVAEDLETIRRALSGERVPVPARRL